MTDVNGYAIVLTFLLAMATPALVGLTSGGSPLRSVLGSVQKGVVAQLAGLAVMLIGGCSTRNRGRLGCIFASAGVAFPVSAAVTYRLSKSWGPIPKKIDSNWKLARRGRCGSPRVSYAPSAWPQRFCRLHRWERCKFLFVDDTQKRKYRGIIAPCVDYYRFYLLPYPFYCWPRRRKMRPRKKAWALLRT